MRFQKHASVNASATWALNTLISRGKTTDWMVHMLGQSVGAYTDATHGMTLAAVSLPYYRYICPYGLPKFVRFAKEVWGVDAAGKTDAEIAEEGLAAMEAWMKKLGLTLKLSELGATEDMIEGIADGTFIMQGSYKVLSRDEVIAVLKASL
jgi:alcohol dehydrogenase YqhD (iron-dependent ADH family)